MIKVIFYFLLVSIGAGLVQMKIPLFGRHSKRWEEQNYAQRFGGIFFPAFIALVVIFLDRIIAKELSHGGGVA